MQPNLLFWGHGSRILEIFLEPTCPFSVKAFEKLDHLEFEFENHAGGPNLDSTPNDIIRRIEGYSGLALAEAFAAPELEHDIKWQAKYSRQNGIHVSPTFVVDGLVMPGMSSGDSIAEWCEQIGLSSSP